MSTPPAPTGAAPRRLMAIGGAEDKVGSTTVLRRFVAEAGGPSARIVVCATASALGPEIVELYQEVFTRLGAADVASARPGDRREANDPDLADMVDHASGVFFTGGNQLKLASTIRGTHVGDAVMAAYRAGALVGGTSAGASVVSEHMVAYGTAGASPKFRMAGLAQGLGLLHGVIIDQHFGHRDRFGRLVALAAASPDLLGIGLDEDTAIVVTDESIFEVVGSGSVFVVDLRDAVSDAARIQGTAPVMVSGAISHFLPDGARFDLTTRQLLTYRNQTAPVRDDRAPAGRRLAGLPGRVAAEGVDDAVVARNARRRQLRAQTRTSHQET